MTFGTRLARLEETMTRRHREAASLRDQLAGAREELLERLGRQVARAQAAAREGRRHYLFEEDKAAHLEAHYPGPLAAWWRRIGRALEEARKAAGP